MDELEIVKQDLKSKAWVKMSRMVENDSCGDITVKDLKNIKEAGKLASLALGIDSLIAELAEVSL